MIMHKLNTVYHPLVWGSIAFFILNQFIERVVNLHIPVVHAYLDDLLCMPVVLGLTQALLQKIHPLGNYYYISTKHILFALLFYSILFEWLLPIYNPAVYTADLLDIVFYAIGAFLFYVLITKKSARKLTDAIIEEKLGNISHSKYQTSRFGSPDKLP